MEAGRLITCCGYPGENWSSYWLAAAQGVRTGGILNTWLTFEQPKFLLHGSATNMHIFFNKYSTWIFILHIFKCGGKLVFDYSMWNQKT